MKKLTKKAFVALFALFLAVVALGTTTFAWFTLGNTVIVQEFKLDVTGGEGIEFAYIKHGTAGTTNELLSGYVQNMTADEFLGLVATDYGYGTAESFKDEFKFDLVASSDGTTFSKLDVNRDTTPATVTLPQITGPDLALAHVQAGVLEFSLRFRTKAKLETGENKVNLLWNHLTLASDPNNTWRPDRTFTNSKGFEVTPATTGKVYHASDAARVSVTGNLETPTVVYENPLTDTNTVSSNNPIVWNQGAHDYYKKVAGIDLELETAVNTFVPALTTSTSPADLKVAEFGELDGEYRYVNITIRVYIDGFDAEGFNSILSSALKVAFKFTFNKTA